METEHNVLTADGHDGLSCTVLLVLGLRLFPGELAFNHTSQPHNHNPGADPGGGGRWGGRPPLGWKDPRRRRGFPRLKGRKKGHWCLLNGCSTPFRHNMAINILKSCKSVFAYVKNRSFPSHIRSSFPWRPPLAEILDPRL